MCPDPEPHPASRAADEPSARPAADDRPLILRSEDLLQGRREVWIQHGDQIYRLRVTSAGKLYLTK
jgi:hemin uptake protein HemP